MTEDLPDNSRPETFSVLTYNIHKGFSVANRRFTLVAIREALEEISPDVIFLQELQGEHDRRSEKIEDWPLKPQGEFLAENHWPFSLYAKNAVYKKGHHGNGILSKSPIVEWDNVNLSRSSFASRSYLHAKVHLPFNGKDPENKGLGNKEISHDSQTNPALIHLVCVHLGLFEAERAEQLSVVADCIHQTIPEDEPLIMAGDFNDWRKRAIDHMKIDLNLKEAFQSHEGRHARTYPCWNPLLQVDRIYYRGLELYETLNFKQRSWKKLSDHLPIGAVFKCPAAK